MSQADNQNPESRHIKDEPIYGDSSGPLFTIYSRHAEEVDNRQCERWQKDADGIIIFSGLFSAVVAALVVASIQDLRPGPQDTSTFYLEKIYELQADPNVSSPSTPSTLSKPPTFSPPRYAVWVNTFWFLSLVISLSCAMLATSLQQWARRYIRMTQNARCSPHERARLREFFSEGRFKYGFYQVVDGLPALVHLSLFLFFAGLIVYLSNINHTVFTAVICWVVLLSAVYGFITFMPFIWIDSPYYSPLTPPAWFLFTRVSYIALGGLCGIMSLFCSTNDVPRRILNWVRLQVQRTHSSLRWEAKKAISKQSEWVDFCIFSWTLIVLQDDEQEKVFESIPGFFKSDEVKLGSYRGVAQRMIEETICHFLHNTLSSNAVRESVKRRRIATCLSATSEVLPSDRRDVVGKLTSVNWGGGLHSVAIGHSLRSWDKVSGDHFTPYIYGIVAIIVASVRERDESWAKLARDHLGVPDDVFHDYQTHGDSVLLSNLINFMRHADLSESFALEVVGSLSKFDIRDTIPELQRDFCAMWNDLVQWAQNHNADSGHVTLLKEIRHHYIALHRGTDAAPTTFSEFTAGYDGLLSQPSSYPLCNILIHRSRSTTHHVHDGPTAEAFPHPPATSSSLHRDSVLTTTTPFLSLSSHSDDTATKPNDQSTTHILPSPVVPTVSDTISIPQPTFPPSADRTIASVSSPPSTVPVVLLSPYPPTLSSNVPSTGSPSFPMLSPSRYTEAPSGEEIPHPSSSTMIPRAARQVSFDNGATVALSTAMGDPPDGSMV